MEIIDLKVNIKKHINEFCSKPIDSDENDIAIAVLRVLKAELKEKQESLKAHKKQSKKPKSNVLLEVIDFE